MLFWLLRLLQILVPTLMYWRNTTLFLLWSKLSKNKFVFVKFKKKSAVDSVKTSIILIYKHIFLKSHFYFRVFNGGPPDPTDIGHDVNILILTPVIVFRIVTEILMEDACLKPYVDLQNDLFCSTVVRYTILSHSFRLMLFPTQLQDVPV